MLSLAQTAADRTTLTNPGPWRIARAVAFGIVLVPLMILCSVNRASPFDAIAFGFEIAVTLVLFHAGSAVRTPRLIALELGAVAMMLFADVRLWQAGPDLAVGLDNAALYRPLLAVAALATLGSLGLLAAQARRPA